MQKLLEIKSKGLIEKEAISLIGASTKGFDDDKIGQFGSGLPYSIASMLRQGVTFMIFSGKDEIKISTKKTLFRGQEFEVITINGEDTSFTTSMGTKDWKGAFPFVREIYSNALDEDEDATIKIVDDMNPEDNFTSYYIIANEDIINLTNNIGNYFVKTKVALTANKFGAIYNTTEHLRLFRKGILAYEDVKVNSIFCYNLYNIEINESRVINNIYMAKTEVARIIEASTNEQTIHKYISALDGGNTGLFEYDCYLPDWYGTSNASIEFINVISQYKYYCIEIRNMIDDFEKEDRIALPQAILQRFIKLNDSLDIVGLNSKAKNVLEGAYKLIDIPKKSYLNKVSDAVAFLMTTSYNERLDAKIECVKFFKDNVLGMAEDGKILLSEKMRDLSEYEVAKIIIEEQEHIISGHEDKSRSFQDHLFNLYFEQLKLNKNG